MAGNLGRRRFEYQLAARVPAAAVEALAADAARDAGLAALVGGRQTAVGAAGQPARRFARYWEAMAHADREVRLGRIDRRHPRPEPGTVGLIDPQHPVDPGVDHLVAERAGRGLHRQWLQQRSRQHDLAQAGAIAASPVAVEAGAATHAPIAPAHAHQADAVGCQGAFEVLAVQPVKQRQQRNQRHAGEAGAARDGALAG